MNKIGFIGTGRMGGALAAAAAQNPDNMLLLANRHPEKAQALADRIGGTVTDNLTAAAESELLLLCVKPQMLAELAEELREPLRQRKTPFTLVSIIAGAEISRIQELLGGDYPVIRIMPNIPVAVGDGVIQYICSSNVTSDTVDTFLNAFAAAGRFSPLEERLANAAACVSGCGPAFAAMFIEALADGGVACGIPRAKAQEYAAQMALGTAQYLLKTGVHPGELKDAVCSPGGTTIQGVRALEESGFRGAVMDAVIAAYEKTQDL